MFSSNSSQVADDKLFSEDVFSTYLYTGTGAAQTITNGIDLAGKGGLVWNKSRSGAAPHDLFDTARGQGMLRTNTTDAVIGSGTNYITYNSDGFSFPLGYPNENGNTYASWTFREAPKFFDVVTYTGTGANRNIAHNLGVAPGCIIVKRTNTTGDWQVYHRGYDGSFNASYYYFALNLTTGYTQNSGRWNNTQPTSTEFTVGTNTNVNASGGTYVAYLFAHDATSDGVIQCGSYTGNGSATGPTISLGWEPQWVMIKNADSTGNWQMLDNMRGMPVGTADAALRANLSSAEASVEYASPTATGFQITSTSSEVNTNTSTYIYIAIRRGPMKTPTLGTSVFSPNTTTDTNTKTTTNFPVDLTIQNDRPGGPGATFALWVDRLRSKALLTSVATSAENGYSGPTSTNWADNTGVTVAFNTGGPYVQWNFRRAPGFFDEVCYTGTGAAGTSTHNLGVAPELVITKGRGSVTNWGVYHAALGPTKALLLNGTNSEITSANYWNNTAPTATQVSLGATTNSSTTFVAYLFASCPGVSKVGSYTGTGTTQIIDCGFTTGARFVLIKRTDSTGDWYVWDTARGIVAGNDPHLSLNTTAAEVTTDDTIDTDSSGFVVNQVAATNVNVSSATYIYLAIA